MEQYVRFVQYVRNISIFAQLRHFQSVVKVLKFAYELNNIFKF